jgi:hypothetical protein
VGGGEVRRRAHQTEETERKKRERSNYLRYLDLSRYLFPHPPASASGTARRRERKGVRNPDSFSAVMGDAVCSTLNSALRFAAGILFADSRLSRYNSSSYGVRRSNGRECYFARPVRIIRG